MSKFTVFANGRSVAGKATNHMAWATAPDVCKLPNNVPTPFPNWVLSTKIAAGQTTHTTILKKPIWTKPTEAGPPSEPAHAGVNKGVKSGTYQGEAKATSVSQNVIVEGKGVARMLDTTTQNHENTIGIITDAALLDQLLKDWHAKYDEKKVPGPGAKGKGPDGHEPPKAPKTEEKKKTDDKKDKDKSKNVNHEDCFLESAELECSHEKHKAPEGGGVLEVVPQAIGDTIKLKAKTSGALCDKHVAWTVAGFLNHHKQGAEATFNALNVPIPPGPGISALMALQSFVPHTYDVSVECCKGEKPRFTVKAYPCATTKVEFEFEAFRTLAEKIVNKIISLTGTKAKIEVLHGKLSFSGQWTECGPTKACFKFEGEGGFKPFFAASGRYNLLKALGFLGVAITAAEKIGIVLSFFLELRGEIGLSVKGSKHLGCGKGDFKGGASGEVTLSVGVEAGLENKLDPNEEPVIKAEASISCGCSIDFYLKLESSRPVRTRYDSECKLGELKGTVKVTIAIGKFTGWVPKFLRPKWLDSLNMTKSWEVTIWEGYQVWKKEDELFWPSS